MEETQAVQDDVTTPSGTTVIKCTKYCGFSVTGTPEYCREMYTKHEHESEEESWEESEPKSWVGHVFSFYGMIIAMIVCAAIVSIVTKDSSIF